MKRLRISMHAQYLLLGKFVAWLHHNRQRILLVVQELPAFSTSPAWVPNPRDCKTQEAVGLCLRSLEAQNVRLL